MFTTNLWREVRLLFAAIDYILLSIVRKKNAAKTEKKVEVVQFCSQFKIRPHLQ